MTKEINAEKESDRDVRTEFLNIIKFTYLFNKSTQPDDFLASLEDCQKTINQSQTIQAAV